MTNARRIQLERTPCAIRFLAVVVGIVLPAVSIGGMPILDLCLHANVAEQSGAGERTDGGHRHHGPAPSDGAGDADADCTWLGPCSGPLSSLGPTAGAPEVAESPEPALRVDGAAATPRPSSLDFLRPPANPPPLAT